MKFHRSLAIRSVEELAGCEGEAAELCTGRVTPVIQTRCALLARVLKFFARTTAWRGCCACHGRIRRVLASDLIAFATHYKNHANGSERGRNDEDQNAVAQSLNHPLS
jgi:hypothetical protein